MNTPPNIIYSYAECTRANLAPGVSDEVWQCVSTVIEHIHELNEHFIVGKQDHQSNRLVFRLHPTSKNLITIWPNTKEPTLRIDARGSGPVSQNRVGNDVFTAIGFNESFERISQAIYEVSIA